MRASLFLTTAIACALASAATAAAPEAAPAISPTAWKNTALSADQRADLLVKAMTEDEKLVVVTGYFGVQQDWNKFRFPEARLQSAGFVPGVARLGFTPQWQSDAGSGVATQGEATPALERTALPVAEIAARTGFSEVASFRKAFRKWTGNAPSHYRERAGGGGLPSTARSS